MKGKWASCAPAKALFEVCDNVSMFCSVSQINKRRAEPGKGHMGTSKFVRTACAVGLAASCFCALTACSSTEESSGLVAATVNGVEIAEDDITSYIESIRESYSLEDDDSWGSYLASIESSPEDLRTSIIEIYIEEELIRQGAEELGVTVEDSEIDPYIESMRANYDSDEKWEQALQQAGFDDEDAYRELIREYLLSENLLASFEVEDPTDEELLEYASSCLSDFDGAQRSSHILFDAEDTELAQTVLDQINAGEIDFATAAEEYSTDTSSAEDGGDVGWNKINSFVTAYETALEELEVGQVSDLVESTYGIHIITCTDSFTAPEELTSLDQLPDEFIEYLTDELKDEEQSEAYTTWYEEFEESSEIVINDMPEGLSYAVDMSLYETDDESDEETSEDESSTDEDSSTETEDETTSDEASESDTESDASDADDTESEEEATETDSETDTDTTSEDSSDTDDSESE